MSSLFFLSGVKGRLVARFIVFKCGMALGKRVPGDGDITGLFFGQGCLAYQQCRCLHHFALSFLCGDISDSIIIPVEGMALLAYSLFPPHLFELEGAAPFIGSNKTSSYTCNFFGSKNIRFFCARLPAPEGASYLS